MPSTTFLEDEDKELVQIAREFAMKGAARIAWKDVARKMKRWKRSPAELAQRVNSLKRTFGTDLSKFPPSFYTPVRAARGRRGDHLVRIRQGRGQQVPIQTSKTPALQTKSTRTTTSRAEVEKQRDAVGSTPDLLVDFEAGDGQNTVGQELGQPLSANIRLASSRCRGEAVSCKFSNSQRHKLVEPQGGSKVLVWEVIHRCNNCWLKHPWHRRVQTKLLLQCLVAISRKEVVYPPGAPHLNVGELLPSGVAAFISAIMQIRAIGTGDVFMDIGAGVGNVVAQFVLVTAVRASIGIEIRRDLVDRCNEILVEHVMQWPDLQKVEVYAEDVKVELSMIYPFANATMVFANNLRFEPATTNHITNELLFLTDAWIVAFTSEICPRHNSSCTNVFCSRWKLRTAVKVPVSWSSRTVSIYLYTEQTIRA